MEPPVRVGALIRCERSQRCQCRDGLCLYPTMNVSKAPNIFSTLCLLFPRRVFRPVLSTFTPAGRPPQLAGPHKNRPPHPPSVFLHRRSLLIAQAAHGPPARKAERSNPSRGSSRLLTLRRHIVRGSCPSDGLGAETLTREREEEGEAGKDGKEHGDGGTTRERRVAGATQRWVVLHQRWNRKRRERKEGEKDTSVAPIPPDAPSTPGEAVRGGLDRWRGSRRGRERERRKSDSGDGEEEEKERTFT